MPWRGLACGDRSVPPLRNAVCRSCHKRARPAAVLIDDFVDLTHEADCLGKGDDNLVVVGDVVLREPAALAVLEPFLADRVAADVELPHRLGHAREPATLALVDPDGLDRPGDFLNLRIRT